MEAVTFAGCFGWLHRGGGAAGNATAVVICAPFGHEAVWLHRGLRALAETLAARGVPVLRFDYRGTGDSTDGPAAEPSLEDWIDDIRQAVLFIRAVTGLSNVALCGVRFGATLAALAAQEIGDIHAVALLAPVVQGQTFLRELHVLHHEYLDLTGLLPTTGQPAAEHEEALGHRIGARLRKQLRQLDLLQCVTLPPRRVLIVSPRMGTADMKLCARYRHAGAAVGTADFVEFQQFYRDAFYSEVPENAVSAVAGWLTGMPTAAPPRVLPMPAMRVVDDLVMPDGTTETAFRIGEELILAILCQPRDFSPDRPTVVFVNTGCSHHVGDARFAVLFGRRLARHGIASLRVDICGLGDSGVITRRRPQDALYTAEAQAHLHAAIDWLATRGHRRIVALGICSGAYTALHAASANPHVKGLVLLNLPYFFCNSNLEEIEANDHPPTRQYLRALKDSRRWRKVLSGKSRIVPVAALLLQRCARRVRVRLGHAGAPFFSTAESTLRVRSLLLALEKRRVDTHLLFGGLDGGLEELETHFGKHGRRMPKAAHLHLQVFDQIDHALLSEPARERLMAHIETVLLRR